MSKKSDSMVAHDPLKLQPTMADTPLSKYFKAAVKFGASDLIMRGGQPPKLRLKGRSRPWTPGRPRWTSSTAGSTTA